LGSSPSRRVVGSPGRWSSFSSFTVFGLFWGAWGALLPAVKAQTGTTEAEVGMALLVLAVAALPAMISGGWITDRLGDRALGPAVGAFGMAAVLPGLAHSSLALAMSVVAVGATSGALDVTMNAAVAAEEERRQGRLMHAAHALFSAGVVVASVSVGLARSAGAKPLPILAVLSAVVMVAAVAIGASRHQSAGERGTSRSPASPGRGRFRPSNPLLVLGGLCALAYLVENALQSWSALHLEQSLGAGPRIGSLGPALFAAAAGLGRLGAQGVAVRIPDRVLLVAAGGLGAVGTAVTAVAPSAPVALAGVLLAGTGISVAAPSIFSLTGRIVPQDRRGLAMSTVTTMAYLGFVLGPFLVGTVAGALDLRSAFGLVALVAALLAILARFASRPPAPGSSPPEHV
jgi:MFS family permease